MPASRRPSVDNHDLCRGFGQGIVINPKYIKRFVHKSEVGCLREILPLDRNTGNIDKIVTTHVNKKSQKQTGVSVYGRKMDSGLWIVTS